MIKLNLQKGITYVVFTMLFSIFFINQANAQPPPNVGFEYNNFKFWRLYRDPNNTALPTNNGVINTTDIALFRGTTYYTATAAAPYHSITSGVTLDKYGRYPIVCNLPGGGKHSAKLGDDAHMSTAQGISYNIRIPANKDKYKLTLYYAVNLEDPGSHDCWQMPLFKINPVDSATGKPAILCSQISVDICTVKQNPLLAGNWHASKTLFAGDSVYYTAWTPLTMIAKGMGGKTLSLRLMSAGCSLPSPGAHFGYAYVDFDTIYNNANNKDTLLYCKNDTCYTFTPPPGYKDYRILDSATKSVLAIDTSHAANPQILLCGANLPKPKSKIWVILNPYSGFGCMDTVTYFIDTFPTNILPPIVSVDSICVGNSTTLTNTTAGGVWQSLNTNLGTINSAGLFNSLKSGWDTVQYRAKNIWGCPDTAFKPIYNISNQFAPPIAGDSVVCQFHSTTLSNSFSGGSWISLSTSIATIDNTGLLSGLTPGADSIKYTVTVGGCTDTIYKVITVYPTPVVAPIAGLTNICIGKDYVYTDTTANGVWTSSNSTVASIDVAGNVHANAVGTTTIKYVVTNAFGCSDSSSLLITVNPNPVIGPIIGKDSFCIRVIDQLVNANSGGVWSSVDTSLITINSSTGVFLTHQLGTDTLRYTITTTFGCKDSVSKAIVVNPTPLVGPIFASAQYLCVGDTLILSDPIPGGIWSSANPPCISINPTTGFVTSKTSGYAPISYIILNQYGCADTAYLNLFVNALPPLAPITGKMDICIGTTTYLNNFVRGGIWSSGDTNILTINGQGLMNGKIIGSTYIHYTVTRYGCTSSDSVLVHVWGVPAIAAITGSNNVCYGQTISLSSATPGGIWQSLTPRYISLDPNGNGSVTGLAPGVGVLKYTVYSPQGCYSELLDTIVVNSLPKISRIFGRDDVCIGKQITVSTTPVGGVWSLTDNVLANITNIGVIDGLKSGVDTVKYVYTDINGCTDSVYHLLTVDPLPVISAITGNTNFCIGLQSTLVDTLPKKGIWVSTDTSIINVSYDGNVIGVKVGSATVRYIVTSKQGCTDSVATFVTVNPLPVVKPITGAGVVCEKDSIKLSNASIDPGKWSVIDNVIASIDSVSGMFTGLSAGIDSVVYTVTNSFGCIDKKAFLVKVNPLPFVDSVQVDGSSLCVNDSIKLQSNTQGGVWTILSPSIASINYTTGWLLGLHEGMAAVRYTLTSGYGCKDSIIGYQYVKGRAKVNFVIPTNICLPEGVGMFTSSSILPFDPLPVNYVWDFGDANNTTLGFTDTVTHRFIPPIPAAGYNVKLVVTASGCTSDTTILMPASYIHPQPQAGILTVPSPAEVCLNSSIVFGDNSSINGVIPQKSIWYLGDNTIDTSFSLTYQYAYPTTYWAYHRIIDQYGCLSDSSGVLVTIDSFPTLNVGPTRYINAGDSAILDIIAAGNVVSYNWSPAQYLNNSTVHSPICTPTTNTTYLVSVTGVGGCVASDSLRVIALGAFRMPNAFSPDNNGVHDKWGEDVTDLKQYPDVKVKIFNRLGQEVFSSEGKYKAWNGRYNNVGEMVPVGVYYYIIDRGNGLPVLSGGISVFR